MKVRPAVIADLRQLIALFQQEVAYQRQIDPFFDLVSGVDWSYFVRAKLENSYERVFVAERDEQLVGFIDVRVSYSPTPRPLRRILGRLLGRNIMPSIVRRPLWAGSRIAMYSQPYDTMEPAVPWCKRAWPGYRYSRSGGWS